jgi:protein-S-isoprenylcysteine O-methyltransferase Ste14
MRPIFRTVVFTIFVPGILAGVVPILLLTLCSTWSGGATGILADVLGLVGVAIYLWCAFWAFARFGGGTPAPIDPPKRLVVHGLYRWMRNPMYVGVGSVLVAEAIGFRSRNIAIYWLIWCVCVYLFVLLYEEPALRRKFGAEYDEYCHRVNRWIPKLRGQN